MEFRWDGGQAEKNLGDNPTKAQINALFAIPGDTKSDSSLPHHAVSSDGTVGAADQAGCTAAIAALNGGRGGVNASAAEKTRAYSHLASHLRSMGADPPDKQFARAGDLKLRAQRRSGMLRVPERLALQFGAAGIEMRSRPSGTGGTNFSFDGYAAVFDYPFEMWDFWGDPFAELISQGAFSRTLANNCDVPFLIGHNDAGITLARTKSGTMQLGQDTHGLHVHIPALDGSREDVRALASAHERGDMDEMSCAFVAIAATWSPDYEQRTLTEMDLHKGDVSAVVFGANDGTAGSAMGEALTSRRPTGIMQRGAGQSRALPGYSAAPDYDPQPHSVPDALQCPAGSCTVEGGAMNGPDAKHCDQCGAPLYDEDGLIAVDAGGVPEEMEGDSAQALAARQRQLELLRLSA